MFGLLKERLKNAVKVFSRKVEEEIKEEEKEQPKKKEKEKKEKTAETHETLKENFFEEKEVKKEGIKTSEEIELEAKKEDENIAEILEDETENIEELRSELDKDIYKLNQEAEETKVYSRKQQEEKEKKNLFARLLKKKKENDLVEEKETKGFFGKIKETITTKTLSESKFEDLFSEIEIALLENNVALSVIEKIKENLKKKMVNEKIKRNEIENIVFDTVKKTISEIISYDNFDLIEQIREKRRKNEPYVIAFFGVNGSGKTTNLAKLAKLLLSKGFTIVMAACDTFRAAAIQQLEEHANNLNVKLIKYDYGADAAAVAFDAVKYAKQKNIDVVLIDTAGRMHSNVNLMEELRKVVRVSKPDLKIFVGESITGNDCVEQAETFNEMVGIDAIILTKADVDEKGGAAVSISYVIKKPILYIGVGQGYEDLAYFSKEAILANLGL